MKEQVKIFLQKEEDIFEKYGDEEAEMYYMIQKMEQEQEKKRREEQKEQRDKQYNNKDNRNNGKYGNKKNYDRDNKRDHKN